MYLGGTMVANVVAAQSVHVWFEYNFAEGQLKVRPSYYGHTEVEVSTCFHALFELFFEPMA